MLCKATIKNRKSSSLVKAGFALAALLGTLFIGSPAKAQYGNDSFRGDSYGREYNRPNRPGNNLGYPSPDDRAGDYLCNYERNQGDLLDSGRLDRRDRPVYGDFLGDRYSPEPTYRLPDRNGLGRRDLPPRRDRFDDRLDFDRRNRNGRDDYISRRIPLPDLNGDRLDLDRSPLPGRDLRGRDIYDPYDSPLPQYDNGPQRPSRQDRLNRNHYDHRDDPYDYRDGGGNDAPPRPAIPPADQLSETEQIQQKLSARYGNPTIQRFLFNVSPEQTLNVYREASQLIDSRHMEPVSYAARTRRAAQNLIEGLDNREFLSANRISPSSAQKRSFENAMNELLQSRRIQSQNDAVQMVYAMAHVAHQHAGIRPTAVVLEFVYGATESLDRYSTFLPEDPRRQPSASVLDGSVVGIGVEIKPHEEGVEVVKALRGGPAKAAGLQSGDVIVGINGQSLRGRNLNQAVDLIAGPVGSPIYLSVTRNGRQLSPITLTRRNVKIYSVSEVEMMGRSGDVGYIKLDKFAQSTNEEMDEALWNLHRSGMKSLVLDLRGNPGGLLTTAIEMSNKFLPSGTIVSTRGRTNQDNTTERADSNQTWKVPLVVLIDGDSASASEIFAAAIQDNGRGMVVGRKSYGKGTVQTHFPLRSVGGNLKLTTAKFYSPNGREMAKAGVTPDVEVASTAYRGGSVDADRDIAAAVEVAESNRVRNDLASMRVPMGR